MIKIFLLSQTQKYKYNLSAEIKRDKKNKKRDRRVLILGTGEAGKSTIMKQMYIIHKNGFPQEFIDRKRETIAHNIVDALTALLEGLDFQEDNELKSDDQLFEAFERFDTLSEITPASIFALADDISLLWKSPPVQAAYSRRNQFQLVQCAEYFLSCVHRVMDSNNELTNDDILQARVRTTGIEEHKFEMKGDGNQSYNLTMVRIRLNNSTFYRLMVKYAIISNFLPDFALGMHDLM